jgi:hypothetical protein
MKDKMCCFDGDNKNFDVQKLKQLLIQIIEKEKVKNYCFLRKSILDKVALSILKELKIIYPEILLGLILPNIDRGRFNFTQKPYNEYDFFLTDTIAKRTPDGWEIKSWNEYMVDCSTHLICSYSNSGGRVQNTIEYAKRKGSIRIFNLA